MKCAFLNTFLLKLIFIFIFIKVSSASNYSKKNITSSEWKKYDSKAFTTAQKLANDKSALQLETNDHLNFVKVEKDEAGYKHYKFQQYYKNIPVEHATYLIHESSESKVISSNGKLYRGISVETIPSINESEALKKALTFINAKEYAWENEQFSKRLQLIKGEEASYFPSGELKVLNIADGETKTDYKLAYKFNVYALVPLSRKDVYIDAHDGTVLKHYEKIHNCSAYSAKGLTNYYGEVDFAACYKDNSYLLENSIGSGMQVIDGNSPEGNIVSYDNEYFDGDKAATDVHWGTQKTYEYFLTEHNRHSLDNDSMPIYSTVHHKISSDSLNNAFFDGGQMYYGDGDGERYGPFTTLDVVAHEMTHGITSFSSKLIYKGESGALNESFSDIFGEIVESKYRKGGTDWIAGGDLVIQPGYNGIRNLANPNDASMLQVQPDTYRGNFWYSNGNDIDGGVHINSGVQNYWFYLLAEGGSGVNDNGGVYLINGIGMENAAKIAYLNLTHCLTDEATYEDARNGSILAAEMLFGDGSNELKQTEAAWCAVGVGEKCKTKETVSCNELDYVSLLDFHKSATGNPWINKWDLNNQSMDDWYGVTLNESGCVTELNLSDNGLNGKLDASIGKITNLEKLDLSNNELAGEIPNEIGDLIKLEELYLNNNNLNNEVPSTIENLGKIQFIDLSFNELEGQILPSLIYYLPDLVSLNISDNNFIGNIPSGRYSRNKLKNLNLANNNFDGTLPHNLPNFPSLLSLDISGNNFIGSIPKTFGNLTSIKKLDLSNNQFTGEIPAEFGFLNLLNELYLNNNRLSGCYHKNLIQLTTQLDNGTNKNISDENNFDVSWKAFCNNIELGCYAVNCELTDSLALISIYNATDGQNWENKWDLTQPMSTWNGVDLNIDGCVTALCLEENGGLTGSIPAEIGNMYFLEDLSIYRNEISGSIPAEIGQLANLFSLTITENDISGSIPTAINRLKKLEYLNLSKNDLSGSIPTAIGTLELLDVLALENNKLTGSIPTSLGNLKQLTSLTLDNNNLNGQIPETLGNLDRLVKLHLHENFLSGELPEALGEISNLTFFVCRNNLLSGCFPSNYTIICDNIYEVYNKNYYINEGNNFNASWEDFCNFGTNLCTSPCRNTDSLALVELYNATNGLNWRISWDMDLSINNWNGITLNKNGCVDQIYLPYNNLSGKLPAFTGNFPGLTSLNLSNNNLTGSIPSSIGGLQLLKTLDLSKNKLSEAIPSSFENLVSLQFLSLENNTLSKSIPEEIANLTYLSHLNLRNNTLEGSIPNKITSLPHLAVLYLSNNNLEGCYHAKLSKLCNSLDPFQILVGNYRISSGNKFEASWIDFCKTGKGVCIPNPCKLNDRETLIELYEVTDGKDWMDKFQWNLNEPLIEWHGVVLNEEGCVTELNLAGARLKNQLPTEIGNLTNLVKLNLWGNQLTGAIPAEIGQLVNLKTLFLPNNKFSGKIPAEIGNLTELTQLYLQGNFLQGKIPDDLKNLTALEYLEMHDNRLIGNIPAGLAELKSLKNFELQNNYLGACYAYELQTLSNNNNAKFWNISEGNDFDAAWKDFCESGLGSCPKIYTQKTDSLALLAFYEQSNGQNWTEGWDLTLPMQNWKGVTLNNLNRVNGLDLNANNLTGTIANELEDLNYLQNLDLSNNKIDGEIPTCFSNMVSLKNLKLNNNQLIGCFAPKLQNLCSRLNPESNSNKNISDGNQLEADWDGFCEYGIDICNSGDVWPGDFNNNGVVQFNDLLYWGLAKGNEGPVRDKGANEWRGQESPEWPYFVNGINSKHQDGNGDGVVNEQDLILLSTNYAESRDGIEGSTNQNSSNLDLRVVGIFHDSIEIKISYDLYLDAQVAGNIDIHGFAGSIDLGDLPVKDVIVDIDNSFLAPQHTKHAYIKKDNIIDIALTRDDKTNQPVDGPLARIIIVIDDFVTNETFKVKTNGGNTLSANGTLRSMGGSSIYGSINPNNNFTGSLSVFVSTRNKSCEDIMGKAKLNITNGTAPFTYEWSNGEFAAEAKDLAPGNYTVIVTDAMGLTAKIPFTIMEGCNETCPINLQLNKVENDAYQVGDELSSNATIENKDNVEFKAGKTISLENGFSIDVNSNFSAGIEDCE